MESVLLPSQLMGKDTSEIESFPSFVHRLAYEHGVTVGVLINFVLMQWKRANPHEEFAPVKHCKPQEMVRPDRVTTLLVKAFELATGQQLSNSTLRFMHEALGSSSGEIVKGFRWCPECIHEMVSLDVPAYFKLIWHLKSITVCPIHRTPFLSKCSHCGDSQTGYVRRYSLGNCRNCKEPLYLRESPLCPDQLLPSWFDYGFDIIQLFEDLANQPDLRFTDDGIVRSCEGLFDHYWESGRDREFYSLLDRDEYLSAIFYKKKISLLKARRIAFKLGVPLSVLLSGEAHKMPEFLENRLFCKLPRGYLEIRRKEPKNHIQNLNRIDEYVRSCSNPPSIKQVAKAADLSVGYMNYRFPHLVSDIGRKYKDYREELRQRKTRMARQLALEYFAGGNSQSIRQSRKHAYKVIRSSTGLPKHLLKKAINDVYRGLFGDANCF